MTSFLTEDIILPPQSSTFIKSTQPSILPASASSKVDFTLPLDLIQDLHSQDYLDRLLPYTPLVTKSADQQNSVQDGAKKETGEAFLNALAKESQKIDNLSRTTNADIAFKSSNSPLVDLSFDLHAGITPSHLHELLPKAFQQDPLKTLKVIFQCRSIHEGKGEREVFYRCLGWLWENHPRTMVENLPQIVLPTCARPRNRARDEKKKSEDEKVKAKKVAVEKGEDDDFEMVDSEKEVVEEAEEGELPEYPPRPHGYYKDLLNILALALANQFSPTYFGELTAINEALGSKKIGALEKKRRLSSGDDSNDKKKSVKQRIELSKHKLRVEVVKQHDDPFMKKYSMLTDANLKQDLLRERLLTNLSNPKFRALFIAVTRLFARQLACDLTLLSQVTNMKTPKQEEKALLFQIQLAGKWAPTPGHSSDKQTLLSTAISHLLFPAVFITNEDGHAKATTALARQALQKNYLTPLRAILQLPEVKMTEKAEDWKAIKYDRVASKSMQRNKGNFSKWDMEGFKKYMHKVKSGKSTISGAALMPHEILIDSLANQISDEFGLIDKDVLQMQWNTLLESIASSGNGQLSNCLAICDVSGSMGGLHNVRPQQKKHPLPIFPALAMTILLSQLSKPPFKNKFISFSSSPKLLEIKDKAPIWEIAQYMVTTDWEQNTNFVSVFLDLILPTAIKYNLTNDELPKKLFVFSDMQFDSANSKYYQHDGRQQTNTGSDSWNETSFQLIQRKFKEAGYADFPEIVFWNLQGHNTANTTKPVEADQPGVALLSGFSGAMMKYFLRDQEDEEMDDLQEQIDDMQWNEDGSAKVVQKGKKKKSPEEVLDAMLSKECFSGLKVFD